MQQASTVWRLKVRDGKLEPTGEEEFSCQVLHIHIGRSQNCCILQDRQAHNVRAPVLAPACSRTALCSRAVPQERLSQSLTRTDT